MVKKKGKSKRTSLSDKYKIQRRVVATHRKSRKQAKRDAKNGIVRHDKKKKDPGIPNSWPFKQDLLNEISRAREKAEQKAQDAKQKRKNELRMLREHQEGGGTARTVEELMALASKSRDEYEAKQGVSSSAAASAAASANDGVREMKVSHGQQSRRAYLRELKKVVESSDVLLQVLDARDPMGTRINPSVEDAILSHHDKRMVLVLNKIDLVPKTAVAGWLTALRRSRPAVAIKAGTNQSRTSEHKSSVGRTKGDSALGTSSAVGVEGIMSLLKNYARASSGGSSKGSITVGVIGYPNVGKSSIINTLKRSRAVGVSPRPGFTTSLQEVVLDRSIRLVDSPGVVFDDDVSSSSSGSSTLLRNCVDADSVDDPIPAVQALIEKCTPESLMMTYELPAFPPGDAMVFLAMMARKNGKVLKGGIPDKIGAARSVLRDWNSGKIPYFTPPPAGSDEAMAVDGAASSGGGGGNGKGDAVIVTKFAEEFDVAKLDDEVLGSLEEKDEMDFVQVKPTSGGGADKTAQSAEDKAKWDELMKTFLKKGKGDDEEEDEDSAMDEDDDAMPSRSAIAEAEDYDFEDM